MKSTEQKKQGQVIEFPKAKVVKHPRLEASEKKATFFSEPHKKYLMSLGSALLVAALFNVSNFSSLMNEKATQSRSLASVAEEYGKKRDEGYEKRLVETLSAKKERKPASLGHEPTKIDDFRYGFLGSKYAVSYYQDKIQSVAFENGSGGERPEYISDRAEFMMQRRYLWPVKFSSVINKSKEKNGERVFETYALLSEEQKHVGSVEFELDQYGRLYKMKLAKSVQN